MFKGDKFFDRTKKRQKLLQEATIFAFLKLCTYIYLGSETKKIQVR